MSGEDLHNSCRALTWAVILTIPSNQIVMVLLLLCTQRLRVTAIRGKVLSAWRERRSISIRRRRLRFVPCRLSPSPGYQIDPILAKALVRFFSTDMVSVCFHFYLHW